MITIDEIQKENENTAERYSFRRDFYYDVKKAIEKNTFSFLLGPRKCGKTVCMKQLLRDYTNSGINAKYINFKALDHGKEQFETFRTIKQSLKTDEPIIYLLDEVTSLENAELKLGILASETDDLIIKNTKILFTGSQSVTIEAWADRAFNDNAEYIYTDFLSYPEYLKYKKIEDVSEESYLDFLYNVADFYNMPTLERYLKKCLEETIVSNSNTINYIYNSECDKLQDPKKRAILVEVCYQTLFSLHNQVSHETFMEGNRLQKDIPDNFDDICTNLNTDDLIKRINESFIDAYKVIQRADKETLRQAFIFLERCNLITITPIVDDTEHLPDITDYFKTSTGREIKNDLFRDYTITINYPMFYMRILQDILREHMPASKDLPRKLLGSIVECHARGLLPDGYEIKKQVKGKNSKKTKEIDYVNPDDKIAVEFTVSNNHVKNFYLIPEDWNCKCTILTQNEYEDRCDSKNNIEKIPYYEFIYQLGGEEYAEKLKAMRQDRAYAGDKDKKAEPESTVAVEDEEEFER